ncbi:hypothetical protein N7466_006311 [Penicillium verhagenii]|uniref:uncharacterized protein n=1 Tax=Penicillium verhagenii TaxID=1562060 RepID=UPI0025457699|nr:uncharacterized protein N7466_006311 [Penicillium verhagenii]KAJ5930818.1 hypothetical protein N7466_006311 [Penicillium verhagenii]
MSKVFFITGAGSGIGRVLARELLLKGYRVFLTDYNQAFLEDTCTAHLPSVLPSDKHENFRWSAMDVSDGEQVTKAIASCAEGFGGIDVLVNSTTFAFLLYSLRTANVPRPDLQLTFHLLDTDAGINSQYMRAGTRMDQVPTSDFERILSVNLVGTYRVSQAAISHLEKSPGGGVIINMSSCRATQQSKHGEAYAASKAGIEGLSMAMSVSLGPKIRVHVVSPGMVDVRCERNGDLLPDVETIRGDLSRDFQSEYAPAWGAGKSDAMSEAHPVGRIGRGEDIARWVEFLGVLESGFTTGGTYLVDGGYSKVLSYPT